MYFSRLVVWGLAWSNVDVVVDVLCARGHVEAIEGTDTSRGVQQHQQVLAGQGCSTGKGAGGEAAILSLLDPGDSYVERLRTLAHQAAMVDLSAVL